MRIREIRARGFKRFADLTVTGVPATARLVMLCGPNGSGKSSLFDALRLWHDAHGSGIGSWDMLYHRKTGTAEVDWNQHVSVAFHDAYPQDYDQRRAAFYIRSAYRHEADFTMNALSAVGSVLDAPKAGKLIDTEAKVADNYRRLVSATLAGVFSGEKDAQTVAELRESLVGVIRRSMLSVFGDLVLEGPGDPLNQGTFYFSKAGATGFHYKNLSGGEKAAFDLLLDFLVKRTIYSNTVYCLDEPELHMNTRLQAKLLQETLNLLPGQSQLWVATHSIGMMRQARDMAMLEPGTVVFLDFQDQNFEETVVIQPSDVDRAFWTRQLDVALGDLARLVAPSVVVLCEGNPAAAGGSKSEFDARCYRSIFSVEEPDVDFVSVGNELDVQSDRLEVGRAIQTLVSGTRVIRLVDRDDRSDREIEELAAQGVRALSERHLESYLLSDELLGLLCDRVGKPDQRQAVLDAKASALKEQEARGRRNDDLKAAKGAVTVSAKRILDLRGAGNTADAFLLDTMVPLLRPGTATYTQLKRDVFG